MTTDDATQPDIEVFLDRNGVIQRVALANGLADETCDNWIGKTWSNTVEGLDPQQLLDLVRAADRHGVSRYVRLQQRFPSGLSIPFEYLAVRLRSSGIVAIGRDVRGIAQLQSRLAAARTAIERNYWQLREFENRYRTLFESTSDALAMVRARDFSISEANPAAIAALGLASLKPMEIGGRTLLDLVHTADRELVRKTLQRATSDGKAPRVVARFGHNALPLVLNASLLDIDQAEFLLINLSDSPNARSAGAERKIATIAAKDIISLAPDGIAVLDENGVVAGLNAALLSLLEETVEDDVIGRPFADWCEPTGSGLATLLSSLATDGVVKHFATTLIGARGGRFDADIAAVMNTAVEPAQIFVYVRDGPLAIQGCRSDSYSALAQLLNTVTDQLQAATLKGLAGQAVALVEKHYIEAALDELDGNRTAAALLLGISRQSLYDKIVRYGIETARDTA
jgi:transcriptional regulator PpsR